MKFFLLLIPVFLLTMSKESCRNKKSKTYDSCFKGKLEIKAACMNYTIGIVKGNIDSNLINPTWRNESTGKIYKNVFALASRCTFPATIKEGDEFYFMIDSTSVQNCAVCMIYYPVPGKKLSIKVIQDPCSQ